MVLGSHRPDWDVGSLGTDRVTALSLNRLASIHVRQLARAVVGDDVEDDVLDEIAARTDGNPLYIEEFSAASTLRTVNDVSAVPTSLSASLTAQLDRLGDAKQVAQTASVIGRQFSQGLLAEVLEEAASIELLDRLVSSGLVVPFPLAGEREFTFKHALVRDAAYESLLNQNRRRIHHRVAECLAAGAGAEPELIGQHFYDAQDWEQAVEFWRQAGGNALAVGATQEATSHLDAALVALGHCPAGDERDRVELEVLLDLAPAAMTVRGYAAARPKELYDRAFEVAATVGDENQRFTALWGGYYITEVRGDWKQSAANIDHLLKLDTGALRRDLPLQIDHAAMNHFVAIGQVERAVGHAQRVMDAYDLEVHASHKRLFAGHDPAVCAMGQLAGLLPELGRPDRAYEMAEQARQLAAILDHPPSTALGQWMNVWMLMVLGDVTAARTAIAEWIQYCTEHRVSAILKMAEFYELAVSPDRAAAHAGLRARIDPMRERERHALQLPIYANFCAEAAIDVGEIEHALLTLDYSQRVAESTGEILRLGQTHYLRGEALRAGGERDLKDAIGAFRSGIQFCETMGHQWTRLKLATSLAELLHETGDTQQARTTLTPAFQAFSEGHHTSLLRRARALNDQLH